MTEFMVGAWDVVDLTVWLVIAIVLAVVVYTNMSRPRLRLSPTGKGLRTTRRDVVLYVLTAPLLVIAWLAFFVVILIAGANNLTGDEIVKVSMGVVIGSRLLAHAWHEAATELAKTVPITLVALILIAGGIRAQDSLVAVFERLGRTGVTGPAVLVLVLSDYAFTALWYWVGVRWLHPHGHRVPGTPAVAAATEQPQSA